MFAATRDRLARFKREAQLLASLNHPNIAAIYGFEESAECTRWCWSSSRGRRWPNGSRRVRFLSTRRWRSPGRSPTPSRPHTSRGSFTAI